MELVWILVHMELAWMLRPSQGTKKLPFGLFRELWPLALNSLLDPYVKARFLCGSYKTRTDAGRDKDIRGRNPETQKSLESSIRFSKFGSSEV